MPKYNPALFALLLKSASSRHSAPLPPETQRHLDRLTELLCVPAHTTPSPEALLGYLKNLDYEDIAQKNAPLSDMICLAEGFFMTFPFPNDSSKDKTTGPSIFLSLAQLLDSNPILFAGYLRFLLRSDISPDVIWNTPMLPRFMQQQLTDEERLFFLNECLFAPVELTGKISEGITELKARMRTFAYEPRHSFKNYWTDVSQAALPLHTSDDVLFNPSLFQAPYAEFLHRNFGSLYLDQVVDRFLAEPSAVSFASPSGGASAPNTKLLTLLSEILSETDTPTIHSFLSSQAFKLAGSSSLKTAALFSCIPQRFYRELAQSAVISPIVALLLLTHSTLKAGHTVGAHTDADAYLSLLKILVSSPVIEGLEVLYFRLLSTLPQSCSFSEKRQAIYLSLIADVFQAILAHIILGADSNASLVPQALLHFPGGLAPEIKSYVPNSGRWFSNLNDKIQQSLVELVSPSGSITRRVSKSLETMREHEQGLSFLADVLNDADEGAYYYLSFVFSALVRSHPEPVTAMVIDTYCRTLLDQARIDSDTPYTELLSNVLPLLMHDDIAFIETLLCLEDLDIPTAKTALEEVTFSFQSLVEVIKEGTLQWPKLFSRRVSPKFLDIQNGAGETPLCYLVLQDNCAAAQRCLMYGADINASSVSPLALALQGDVIASDMVDVLMQAETLSLNQAPSVVTLAVQKKEYEYFHRFLQDDRCDISDPVHAFALPAACSFVQDDFEMASYFISTLLTSNVATYRGVEMVDAAIALLTADPSLFLTFVTHTALNFENLPKLAKHLIDTDEGEALSLRLANGLQANGLNISEHSNQISGLYYAAQRQQWPLVERMLRHSVKKVQKSEYLELFRLALTSGQENIALRLAKKNPYRLNASESAGILASAGNSPFIPSLQQAIEASQAFLSPFVRRKSRAMPPRPYRKSAPEDLPKSDNSGSHNLPSPAKKKLDFSAFECEELESQQASPEPPSPATHLAGAGPLTLPLLLRPEARHALPMASLGASSDALKLDAIPAFVSRPARPVLFSGFNPLNIGALAKTPPLVPDLLSHDSRRKRAASAQGFRPAKREGASVITDKNTTVQSDLVMTDMFKRV